MTQTADRRRIPGSHARPLIHSDARTVAGCWTAVKRCMLRPMSTVTFDTLEITRRLRDAGFDEKQAEAVVRAIAGAQDSLVTREYLDSKLEPIKWMIGVLIGLAVANFAKQFF